MEAQAPGFVFLPTVGHMVEVKEGPGRACRFDVDIKAREATEESGEGFGGRNQTVQHGGLSGEWSPTMSTPERHNKPSKGDLLQVGRGGQQETSAPLILKGKPHFFSGPRRTRREEREERYQQHRAGRARREYGRIVRAELAELNMVHPKRVTPYKLLCK